MGNHRASDEVVAAQMIAKQTAASAAVAVVLAGSSVIAIADPDEAASPVADPAAAEPPDSPPPAEPGADPPKRKPTGRFEVGVGSNPDEPFIATATVAQDDLFRTGMQLALSARLSAREQLALVRFVEPTLLGSDVSLSADVYSHRRQLPGFTRHGAGGVVTLSRPLGEHLRGFIGYRFEEVSVEPGDNLALARAVDGAPLGGGTISALRAGLDYDAVDSQLWPRHGTRAGVMVEHADRRLGSDFELDRAKGWLQHHRGFGPFTLHLGFAGEAVHTRDPRGLPHSERLFLDGSSDIRGYRPGAFAPFGGDLKLTGRGELELPLIESIGLSAAGFVDVGGIWDRAGHGAMGHSFGVGLVWHSPIGTLRFDWAFPGDGEEPRFLFAIGSGF
jgi:outer membrane protein insertion porin family